MKAMVYEKYGSPEQLVLRDIEKPAVIEGEVLVKMHVSSVNWLDWHFLTGTPFLARFMAGLLKPRYKVLGIDLAGQVEAVGQNVTRFQPGNDVFGWSSHGCFAEYVCVSEEQLAMKPANVAFEEAAAVPAAAATALHALRDLGRVKQGQKVLINGASGGVGSFALQLSRVFGAEITGVCSTGNVDLVSELGTEQVVDYTREDFTQATDSYDLVFDVAGKSSFSDCKRILNPEGIYITSEFSPGLALIGQWSSITGNKKMMPLPPKQPTTSDLNFLSELIEDGNVVPIIDRSYSLSEVPQALRYLERGHARGKVVICI